MKKKPRIHLEKTPDIQNVKKESKPNLKCRLALAHEN